MDIPIHFLPNANSQDFMEKKLNDEFADNAIYIVENLNFHPEEFGYVEPEPKDQDTTSALDIEEQKQPPLQPLQTGKDGKPIPNDL
jgi:hypothetical protein